MNAAKQAKLVAAASTTSDMFSHSHPSSLATGLLDTRETSPRNSSDEESSSDDD
jgi:hypothetical protein